MGVMEPWSMQKQEPWSVPIDKLQIIIVYSGMPRPTLRRTHQKLSRPYHPPSPSLISAIAHSITEFITLPRDQSVLFLFKVEHFHLLNVVDDPPNLVLVFLSALNSNLGNILLLKTRSSSQYFNRSSYISCSLRK